MELLQLKCITKSFDGLTVIDDLSASFERGKVTGLVGPNGAGKTTLFNVIAGVLTPDRGEIVLSGTSLNALNAWQRAQFGIGRLWQDVRVFEKLTVLENVLVARKGHPGEGIRNNFLRNRTVSRFERENLEYARRWLDSVGLSREEGALAGSLSFGQQKLLAIARLLANDATLLLLDEPTSGIHPDLIGSILTVIRKIAQDGKTIIVIEHNFGLVRGIADWLHVMHKGRIEVSGRAEEVAQDPLLREVYLGI